MEQPFILGLNTAIKESPFLATEKIYGQVGQNTGNLAFHYAIDRQLGGNLKTVGWEASIDQIDKTGRLAVLPCANQLGPHANYGGLAKKFASIKPSIVAIGLGAQAGTDGKIPEIPQGSLDWVRSIADHAPRSGPNISVRGQFTKEVLEHYGLADCAVVLGCPTLFINPDPALGCTIAGNVKEPKRIAVAAGHQRWKHLSRIEASLAHMVTATGGTYVGQSPLEMVMLTRGEAKNLDTTALIACRDYICPEMDIEEFTQWSKIHGNVFFDIPSWMEHYRRFDFVVGTRIHGVILALQAGVPALCIAHDSRTLELCQTMLVPYVRAADVAGGLTRSELLKHFEFDPAAFNKNRKLLAKNYIDFLSANELTCSSWLNTLAI